MINFLSEGITVLIIASTHQPFLKQLQSVKSKEASKLLRVMNIFKPVIWREAEWRGILTCNFHHFRWSVLTRRYWPFSSSLHLTTSLANSNWTVLRVRFAFCLESHLIMPLLSASTHRCISYRHCQLPSPSLCPAYCHEHRVAPFNDRRYYCNNDDLKDLKSTYRSGKTQNHMIFHSNYTKHWLCQHRYYRKTKGELAMHTHTHFRNWLTRKIYFNPDRLALLRQIDYESNIYPIEISYISFRA